MRWTVRAVGVVFGGLLLTACHQGATTFSVDTTDDTVDINPGDGACRDAAGDCSLRAAVQEANALPGVEEITLSGGSTYTLTIVGAGEDASASGDLDITSDMVLNGNGATVDAGGFAQAFELRQAGLAEILDLEVTGAAGSGVRAVSGINLVTDAELTANGTGIEQAGGTLFLWSSTASGNSGDGVTVNGGVAQLQNATLSGNAAAGLASNGGTSTLIHSTITENDIGLAVSGGAVDIRGSIVTEQASGADCAGLVASGGHNLDSDGSCGFGLVSDITVASAELGSLADNGGPVRTHAPSLTSAAVNSATATVCTTGSIDARGISRPASGFCDRGAVEVDTVGSDCQPLNIGPGAQLQNCDLGGANLALANLAGADLTGANLAGANLILADLSGATLSGARLDNADATDANLNSAVAHNAVFDQAILLRSDLTGAQLGGANLYGVIGTSLTTVPASLPTGWAILQQRLFGAGVDLAGLDLTGLDLSNLDLRDTDLSGATLTTATIAGTQFAGSNMSDILGKNVVGVPASMPTDFFVESGWIFGPGLNIVGDVFSWADFTGADFTGRNLTGIRLGDYTIFNNADFSGADLSYAVLDGLAATGADLRTATMWRLQGREVNGEPLLPAGWVRSLRILFGPGVLIDGITKGSSALVSGADLTDAIITDTSIDLHFVDSILVRTQFVDVHAQNGDISIHDSDATDALFQQVGFAVFGTPEITGTNLTGVTFDSVGGAFIFNENNITGADLSGGSHSGSSWHSHKRTAGWGMTGTPASLPAGYSLTDGFLLPDDGAGEIRGDAPGQDFSGADINGTWADANLAGTDFTGASIQGFEDVDLSGADLTDARVSRFLDTEVGGAVLTGADLRDVSGDGNTGSPATLPSGTLFLAGRFVGPTADLSGADLSSLDLTSANLSGADLTNANLSNSVYALGDLRGAAATGIDLTAANLLGTRIDGVDLTGATWSGTICPDATNSDTNGSGSCIGHDAADRWDVILDPAGAATPLAGLVVTLGDSLADPMLEFVSGTTILEGPPDNGVDWFINGLLFRDDDHNAPFQISAMRALPTGVSFNGQGPAGSGNTFLLDVGIHTISAIAETPTGSQTFTATFRVDEP